MSLLKITDLGPRNDLKSLAYTAFFLLTADLPWRTSGSHNESMKNNMQHIRASKAATSGDKLGASFPEGPGCTKKYRVSGGELYISVWLLMC